MKLTSDRGQRDVHDRAVQADNEQAHAADAQHQQAALAAQFWHGGSPRWRGTTPGYLR
jgi:hypothetical protein